MHDTSQTPDAARTASLRFPSPAAMAILVVEDNTVNQIVVKRLLERRGHAVTAVDNGQAALDLLGRVSFDCVLMDVEMPGLSGPETLARLRDGLVFGPASATPVLALTAHDAPSMRERLLAGGFDDYVAKPIDIAALEAALARVAAARSSGGMTTATGA